MTSPRTTATLLTLYLSALCGVTYALLTGWSG